MFTKRLIKKLSILLLAALPAYGCQTGLNEVLSQVTKEMNANHPLSTTDIIAGLKQALEVGTANTVNSTSDLNGYYKNPQIKIPLPAEVRKVEDLLRTVGFGSQVDAFEISMNRAAERAAPEAKALFYNAIAQMTFADAKQILNGREDEATLYFKRKTYQPLEQRFKPLVHNAMSEVGVTRYYQDIDQKLRVLPMGNALAFDLDQYVTARALDGLFLVLAQEEAKIRQDPAARATELLKRVFGSKQ